MLSFGSIQGLASKSYVALQTKSIQKYFKSFYPFY